MAGTEPGPAPGGRADPEGPDPQEIPDPMPEDLRTLPDGDQFDDAEPMEGEAPTG